MKALHQGIRSINTQNVRTGAALLAWGTGVSAFAYTAFNAKEAHDQTYDVLSDVLDLPTRTVITETLNASTTIFAPTPIVKTETIAHPKRKKTIGDVVKSGGTGAVAGAVAMPAYNILEVWKNLVANSKESALKVLQERVSQQGVINGLMLPGAAMTFLKVAGRSFSRGIVMLETDDYGAMVKAAALTGHDILLMTPFERLATIAATTPQHQLKDGTFDTNAYLAASIKNRGILGTVEHLYQGKEAVALKYGVYWVALAAYDKLFPNDHPSIKDLGEKAVIMGTLDAVLSLMPDAVRAKMQHANASKEGMVTTVQKMLNDGGFDKVVDTFKRVGIPKTAQTILASAVIVSMQAVIHHLNHKNQEVEAAQNTTQKLSSSIPQPKESFVQQMGSHLTATNPANFDTSAKEAVRERV